MLELGVTRSFIEFRGGSDELDRQVLIDELRRRGAELTYAHLPPHADPLLWIADALAWCYSAGGSWRDRIATLTTGRDVTAPEKRETRPHTVRRGAGFTSWSSTQ